MDQLKTLIVLVLSLARALGSSSDQGTCFESTDTLNNVDDSTVVLDTSYSGVQLLFPDLVFNCNGHITGIEMLVHPVDHSLTRSLYFQVWEPIQIGHSYKIKIDTKMTSNKLPENNNIKYENISDNFVISVEPGDIIGMYVPFTTPMAPFDRPLSPLYTPNIDNTSADINDSSVYQGFVDFPPCEALLCSSKFQLLTNIDFKLQLNYSSEYTGTVSNSGDAVVCMNEQLFESCPSNVSSIIPSITSSSTITYSTSSLNGSLVTTTPNCSSESCSDNLFLPVAVLISVPIIIIVIILVLTVLTIVIYILHKKKVIQKSTEKVYSSSIEHYEASNGSLYATVSLHRENKSSTQEETEFANEEVDGLQPYAELRTVIPEPMSSLLSPHSMSSMRLGSIPSDLPRLTNSIPHYAAASMFDTRFMNHTQRSATLSLPRTSHTSSMLNIRSGRRATVSGISPFQKSPNPYISPLSKQKSSDQIFSFKERLPSKPSKMSEVSSPSSMGSPFLPSVGENEEIFCPQPYQEPVTPTSKMSLNNINGRRIEQTKRTDGGRKMSVPIPDAFLKHRVLKKANSIDFASPYLEPSPTLKTKRQANSSKMSAGASSVIVLPRVITDQGSLIHNDEYARLDRPNNSPQLSFRRPSILSTSPPSESLYDTAHPQQKYREISKDDISIGLKLGSGHFGTVFSGVWKFDGGHLDVAFKVLKSGLGQIERDKFLHEAEIMGQFFHQNVVQLHGVISIGEPLMICLELMSKGDLKHYLKEMKSMHRKVVKNQTKYAEQFLSFCRQVADGMSYLAGKDFVHRDLAARNIFLTDQKICKIGDFGMSRGLAHDEIYESKGCDIPLRWTSPEAVKYLMYTIASDVWSYGMLLFEIWSIGCKPFHSNTVDEIHALISSPYCLPPPPGCPRYIYKLMVDCWNHEPSGRPTFFSIVDILSRHDSSILDWNNIDQSVSEMCTVLGAPLEEGKYLFPDLQDYYNVD